jgi:hypothetical protein
MLAAVRGPLMHSHHGSWGKETGNEDFYPTVSSNGRSLYDDIHVKKRLVRSPWRVPTPSERCDMTVARHWKSSGDHPRGCLPNTRARVPPGPLLSLREARGRKG